MKLEFNLPPSPNGKCPGQITAVDDDGRLVYTDRGDLFRAEFRSKFTRGVIDACGKKSETVRSGIEVLLKKLIEKKLRELREEAAHPESQPEPAGPFGRRHLTDLGNARRMIRVADGELRYCYAWGDFLVYDGRRWARDRTGAAERIAKQTVAGLWRDADKLQGTQKHEALKWAQRSESAERIKAMLALCRSEAEVWVSPEQLDADRWALNVRNGTIDLHTGRLRDHSRADLITKLAPVDYDPHAKAPEWRNTFIARITAGHNGLAEYLQRVLGMALTGDISTQALWIFHGRGANGKSVLLDAIAALMGDYAGLAPPSLLTRGTNEHPTELADLMGKRLVIASENDEGENLRVGQVKRLTGDATIKGRFMRQDFFEFPRTHKMILVTNHRPVIRESTHAIWRRIKLVPFTASIAQDKQIDRYYELLLEREAPGILNWLIEGCRAWQKDGKDGLLPPDAVKVATSGYRDEQDPLEDYFQSRLRFETDSKVSRNHLFANYQSYCVFVGEKQPVSRQELYDGLRNREGVSEDEWKEVGIKVRGFLGVELATGATL